MRHLVRLTTADNPAASAPVYIDPDSVSAIWPAGIPGCSTVVHGRYGATIVYGDPDDVHRQLGALQPRDKEEEPCLTSPAAC